MKKSKLILNILFVLFLSSESNLAQTCNIFVYPENALSSKGGICSGTEIHLYSDNPYSAWISPVNNISPSGSSYAVGTITPINNSSSSKIITYSLMAGGGHPCGGQGINIKVNPKPIITAISPINIACGNQITITATGGIPYSSSSPGYDYFLSSSPLPTYFTYDNHTHGNSNANQYSGLCPGNYNITVSDKNQCTDTEPIILAGSCLIPFTVTPRPAICYGSKGGFDLNLPSTVGQDYTVVFDGPTPKTILHAYPSSHINFEPGDYIITATDNTTLCSYSIKVTLDPVNALPLVVSSFVTPSDYGQNNGSITIDDVTGAVGNFTVDWLDITQIPQLNNGYPLAPGAYEFIVTDGHGCHPLPDNCRDNLTLIVPEKNPINADCADNSDVENLAVTLNHAPPLGYNLSFETCTSPCPDLGETLVDAPEVPVYSYDLGAAPTSYIDQWSLVSGICTKPLTINSIEQYPNRVSHIINDFYNKLKIPDRNNCVYVNAYGGGVISPPIDIVFCWFFQSLKICVDAAAWGGSGHADYYSDGNGMHPPQIPYQKISDATFGIRVNYLDANYNILHSQPVVYKTALAPYYYDYPTEDRPTWSTSQIIVPNYFMTNGNTRYITIELLGFDLEDGVLFDNVRVNHGDYIIPAPYTGCYGYYKTNLNPKCAGDANGSITVTPFGGTPPYTYSWSNGGTTANLIGLTAGAYTATVTDAISQTLSFETVLNDPPLLTVNTIVNGGCINSNTASIQATANGGTPPFTYAWNTVPVQTTEIAIGLGYGTYSVTATDANGCTAISSATVSSPSLLDDGNVCTIDACDPLTGVVSHETVNMDDNNICTTDGCNLITGIFHNVINTDDNNVCTIDGCDTMLGVLHYTINMDDGIACTIDDCDPLTGVYHYAAPPINVSPNVNLCAGGFTTLSVSSNNDLNYVYSWSPTTFLDDPASAVPVASGVTFSIIYTVTATDIYTGCTVSATTSVIVAPLISEAATLSSQIACSNTSFTVTAHFSGGGAPYNFTWSDGVGGIYPNAQSITANLPAGTFSFDCTVSDYCGETGISSSPTVIINPAPDLTIATQSNISCNGLNDGSIDLNASNGTPPYEFYLGGLATTDGIYTGLATGNYTATTFDDNGCESAPLIVSITEPSSIIIMDSIISVTSNGANDGIILISVNGGISPYSYLWSTGATTASILSLAGGSYLLTITDANGCSLSNSYLVSEPAPLSLGNYPNTTIVTGGNATITPDNAPISILSAVASTNTNFTGTLTVDPITSIVTVIDAKQAGTYAITVKGFGSGGLTATTTFTLNVINPPCSNGLFTNANDATVVASQPYSIAIGDFNNDGNQDMAVSIPDNNSVSIRMGDGNGNFTGSTNLQVGNSPRWVSVGDFNGDGLEDLAIANINSNSISIRLGNGNGGFDGNTELPVGLNPYCVAIGDFNGDGKSDLATANTDANTVSIRIGDGAGNFSGNLQVPVGSLPFAVAIGDYNNDGNQDLAVANGSGNSVSIRLGDGFGNFSGSVNIPTGTVTTNVQLGDFNNDGNQDLVATNQNSNNISILQGDGNGGFVVTSTLNTGIHPWSSAVGDFNGDGKQDILTANYSGNKVSEYLGDGTGGFFRGTDINISNQPFSIAVGDFNNDSIQDFAVANFGASTVSIRLGLGGTIGTEINLKGNNTGIIDGDVTPDVADGTDFGNVNVGGNIIRTYTIENTGTTDLTLNGISMSGANSPLFLIGGLTIPSTLAPNGSTTFTVAFSPTSSGVKTATVHIANDDCNESDYDFAVRGSGGTGGSVILSQNILLEGYYLGGGMMNGCLNINGISADPMDADSIFISAMNPTSPYAEVDRQTGILKTNGDVSVSFGPSVIADNFYYLKLNHRNSVETWSGAPVQLTAITTYSFSSAASQAFASNEALTSDNLYAAIHTGDLNQDGSVDASDFLELDPSIQNGDGGYLVGDLNGDSSVDASDFLLLDPNIQNGVGVIAP